MYNAHFKFHESPFGVTPDPQFYYSNAVNREAGATLHYGINERKGFILIAGEAGTGKTTLLRKAMHAFGPNVETAYVSHTLLDDIELLGLILTDLGLSDCAGNVAAMIARLYDYAIDRFNNDKIVALLIDEAQDLSPQCLEQLRLLGNLETDKKKLLQIVLVGQPELEQKLERPELRQLKQRVALRCRLEPVKIGEVGAYIEARLQTVGRSSADIFEPQAIERIAAYSNGLPRLINIICDNALLIAYSMSKFKVSADMVREVADDLALDKLRRQREIRANMPVAPVVEQAPMVKQAPLELTPAQEVAPRIREEMPAVAFDDAARKNRKNRIPSRIALRYSRHVPSAAAAMLLIVALGGFLYSYLHKGALSHSGTAGIVGASVGVEHKEPDRGESPRSAETTETPTTETPTIVATNSQPIAATEQIQPVAATEKNGFDAEAKQPVGVAAAEERVIAQPAAVGPTPREDKQSTPPAEQKESNKANFLVVGPSFVRAKPTATAAIIDTLEPGTSINVAGLTGDYYRVRSLGEKVIRGYIHREDAFFERKKKSSQ
jgi:type II secretory pathway predicted ATPase ExeA